MDDFYTAHSHALTIFVSDSISWLLEMYFENEAVDMDMGISYSIQADMKLSPFTKMALEKKGQHGGVDLVRRRIIKKITQNLPRNSARCSPRVQEASQPSP